MTAYLRSLRHARPPHGQAAKKPPTIMTDYLGCPLQLGVACRGPKPTGVRGALKMQFPRKAGPLVKSFAGIEVVYKDLRTFACLRIEAGRRLRAMADYLGHPLWLGVNQRRASSDEGPCAKRLKHAKWKKLPSRPGVCESRKAFKSHGRLFRGPTPVGGCP